MKNGYRHKVPKIRTLSLDTLHVRYKLYEHAYNKIDIICYFLLKRSSQFRKINQFSHIEKRSRAKIL